MQAQEPATSTDLYVAISIIDLTISTILRLQRGLILEGVTHTTADRLWDTVREALIEEMGGRVLLHTISRR